MRLWHYELLDCLDDFHIISQWRELLAIKGAIDKNGTPNHRLVNKVLDYNINEFKSYTGLVVAEMITRNIKYSKNKFDEIVDWECRLFDNSQINKNGFLWHDKRYLTQCYYNLQEKYDCGIVSKNAWMKIENKYKMILVEKIEPENYKFNDISKIYIDFNEESIQDFKKYVLKNIKGAIQ